MNSTDALALLAHAPCGARALAAILGCDLDAAATLLAPAIRAAGFDPREGASPESIATVLLAAAYRMESWAVCRGGWREQTSDQFETENRAMLAARPLLVAALERLDVDDVDRVEQLRREHGSSAAASYAAERARLVAVRRERSERRRVPPLTVAGWLRARPLGTWILCVERHVVVARAGIVIAGDNVAARTYGGVALATAWRVLPPGGTWRVRLRGLRRT